MTEIARQALAVLLTAIWFAALCTSVERREAVQDDGWRPVKIHYG